MTWGLTGLESLTAALAGMAGSGRLPHAILFTGPRGGGKNSLARALAARVNCTAPAADGGPCGVCPSCLKVAKDIHPDLTTLAPSGRSRLIKMEDVQALRGEMAFRPFEGRVKVFIIREADRLGADPGNALLKTLEEPPPDSLLLLTSASEAEVMPTIVSRCLRLRLPPLPPEIIMTALAERRGLTGAAARLLTALSAGALGPAMTLEPEETLARWEELNQILHPQRSADHLEAAWRWVKAVAGDEERYVDVLNLLHLWWRETIRLAAAGAAGMEGPCPSPAQLDWAARLTPRFIESLTQAQARLEDSLRRFVKAELAFENYWLTVFRSA